MAIWKYKRKNTKVSEEIYTISYCIFCNTLLKDISPSETNRKYQWDLERELLRVCTCCGWWQFKSSLWNLAINQQSKSLYREFGAIGTLKEFDLTDISIPIKEIRSYLLAKYEKRFSLNPKLFEETVGSVFEDLGYETIVTSFQNDGGIDVILKRSDSHEVGVQVKRYKNTIEVSQIREFTGTLFLNGFNKGIYITTSSFQSGTHDVVTKANAKGIAIELIDAPRFFDALKLSQTHAYQSFTDWNDEFGHLSYKDFDVIKSKLI